MFTSKAGGMWCSRTATAISCRKHAFFSSKSSGSLCATFVAFLFTSLTLFSKEFDHDRPLLVESMEPPFATRSDGLVAWTLPRVFIAAITILHLEYHWRHVKPLCMPWLVCQFSHQREVVDLEAHLAESIAALVYERPSNAFCTRL